MGLVFLLSCLLEPFMPSFCLEVKSVRLYTVCIVKNSLPDDYHNVLIFNRFVLYDMKVLKQLNLPPEKRLSLCNENGDLERARKPWELMPAGHKIGTPEPLFNELVNMLFCY